MVVRQYGTAAASGDADGNDNSSLASTFISTTMATLTSDHDATSSDDGENGQDRVWGIDNTVSRIACFVIFSSD